jgi:hypothetical protein
MFFQAFWKVQLTHEQIVYKLQYETKPVVNLYPDNNFFYQNQETKTSDQAVEF